MLRTPDRNANVECIFSVKNVEWAQGPNNFYINTIPVMLQRKWNTYCNCKEFYK